MKYEYYNLMQPEGVDDATNVNADDIARLMAPEGSFIENDTEVSEEVEDVSKDTQTTPKDPVETTEDTEEFTPSKDWDLVKDIEGFEMPSDLNADNEQELLKGYIAKKYDITTPELHPLAKQIQDMAAINPNITISDLVNDISSQYVDASNMTDDQVIAFDLFAQYGMYDETNNPDGITQEDVEEHISKLGKIEKNRLAKSIRSNIEEYNNSLTKRYEEANKAEQEKMYNKVVDEITKLHSKLEVDLAKVNSIYGIEVKPEDHKLYLEEFKKLTIPDKETYKRGIDEILSNDVMLYKLFVLATKFGEEKVIEQITKGRESGKEELMKKLKITPHVSGTQRTDQAPDSFEAEIELLKRPVYK